jgi:hypothetical protein
VPHFKQTLKRIGVHDRWKPNFSSLPPAVLEDLDAEDREDIREKFRAEEARNLVEDANISPEMVALATRPPADWDVGYPTPHPELDFGKLPHLERGDARPGQDGGGDGSPPRMATGGFIEESGAAIVHAGETVIPSAEVDRGRTPATTINADITVHAQDGRDAGRQIRQELKRFDV